MTVFDSEQGDPAPKRGEKRRERKTPKPLKPVTEERLQRAALHYLERYASSAENLRRVLRRKVRRACLHHGTPPEEHEATIEAIVARCQRVGYVEDARYAEMRAATLRRRGLSRRMILAKLAEKGVAEETALAALAETDGQNETEGDPDEAAAHAFARRRRLGPYRREAREDRRERDMAALARGGFTFETARRVIDSGADPEA